jgi:hypothetical protein
MILANFYYIILLIKKGNNPISPLFAQKMLENGCAKDS